MKTYEELVKEKKFLERQLELVSSLGGKFSYDIDLSYATDKNVEKGISQLKYKIFMKEAEIKCHRD